MQLATREGEPSASLKHRPGHELPGGAMGEEAQEPGHRARCPLALTAEHLRVQACTRGVVGQSPGAQPRRVLAAEAPSQAWDKGASQGR